jgi:hypothetical protein
MSRLPPGGRTHPKQFDPSRTRAVRLGFGGIVGASLEREVQLLSSHFPEWDNTMSRYEKQLYDDDNDDVSDEDVSTVGEVHKIFETILKACTTCGAFRDTWDFPAKFSLMPFGQETVVHSKKMGAEFVLGGEHHDIFLRTCFLGPAYIRNMGDEFWSCFVELRSLGDFRFEENAWLSSPEGGKAMKGFKNTKSNIFRIIRNYILLEIYQGDSADLGSLEIKWPVTLPWNELISRAVRAFGYFYKMNYMLYKFCGPAQNPFEYMPHLR